MAVSWVTSDGRTQAVNPLHASIDASERSFREGKREQRREPNNRQALRAYQKATHRSDRKPEEALRAEQIMSRNPVTIAPQANIQEAAARMKSRELSRLPVVADDGKFLGVISDGDLERHASSTRQSRLITVESVMTRDVLKAEAETDIRQVAEVFLNEGIGFMPILADDLKLIGVISTSDILRCVARRPSFILWA